MSFSLSVKEELLAIPFKTSDEMYSFLYATLVFNKYFRSSKYLFASEFKDLTNKISCFLYLNSQKVISTASLHYLPCDENIISENIFENFKKHISNTKNDIFIPQILRGIFLACGNLTNPQIDYRMEFSIKDKFRFETLISLLKKVKILNLIPKTTKRKSENLLYIKDNSQITDFLTYIGATNSSMEFIQIKMLKEMRNYINRTTNFETANITKTTMAASEQVDAIKKIIDTIGIDALPENLKETALLRLQNPYLSLDELSKMFSKPVTKSGVNYRLKKLINYIELL